MLQIPDNFPVGDDNIRVSLILVYNDYSQIWKLNSTYTSSNEQLTTAINSYPTDEAFAQYKNLAGALEMADAHLSTFARDGAAKVIVMFWDGDNFLEDTVENFSDTRYCSTNV